MNPNPSPDPREEIEVRITALLLGELPPDEAAALQAQIAGDTRLTALHARLRQAAELLRAACAEPEHPVPGPLQLSEDRRARLLAHFKTPVPAASAVIVKPRRKWRLYVPLSLAAALAAFLGVGLLMPVYAPLKVARSAKSARASDSEREKFFLTAQSETPQASVWRFGGTRSGSQAISTGAIDALRFDDKPDTAARKEGASKKSGSSALYLPPTAESAPASGSNGPGGPGAEGLVLSGENSYAGVTSINGGTLGFVGGGGPVSGIVPALRPSQPAPSAEPSPDVAQRDPQSRGEVLDEVTEVNKALEEPQLSVLASPLPLVVIPARNNKKAIIASGQEIATAEAGSVQYYGTQNRHGILLTPGTEAPSKLNINPASDGVFWDVPDKKASAGEFEGYVNFGSAIQTPKPGVPVLGDIPVLGKLSANHGKRDLDPDEKSEAGGLSKAGAGALGLGDGDLAAVTSGKEREGRERLYESLDEPDFAKAGKKQSGAETAAGAAPAGPSGEVSAKNVEIAQNNLKELDFGWLGKDSNGRDGGKATREAAGKKNEAQLTGQVAALNNRSSGEPPQDQSGAPGESKAERQLAEAKSYFDTDRFDLAFKRTEQVLNIDPYNEEAWQMKEKIVKARQDYDLVAQTERRSRPIERDEERATPVRRFNAPATRAPDGTALKKGDWGKLPKKQADEISKGQSEAVADDYRESVETYYRVIAERSKLQAEAKPKDAPMVEPAKAGMAQKAMAEQLKALPALEKAIAEQKKLREEDAPAPPPAPALVPQPEVATSANAFSTFSLNVSDVAFKLAGASLEQGRMPDAGTVRSEEFINAFDYRDPEPAAGAPLAFVAERARYPFAQNRDLLRFSVKTAAAGRQPGRPLNLVLLLDNSGSMERADRVRILREALRVLSAQLQPQDRLSVVTFARTPRLWADGVAGDQAAAATARVGEITPQGGTNLAAALDLGYATARKHFQPGSISRVVLLTDGAANLGDVNPDALRQKVEANRQQGVALDCFGIGWEGYDDTLLEALARNGDGRYGFINTPEEAASGFAAQLAGALRVAASDVKVQVEWNPKRVTAYRQIGYAKHQLTKEQFRDNTVDAAEIGAAESGNALYAVEVNPRGEGDLATVRVRFKVPGTADYQEHEWAVPFTREASSLGQASPALRLAGTASAFAEWLASSPFAAEVTPDRLLGLLNGVPAIYGADPRPQKLEWMIRTAKSVSGR